MTPPFTTFEDSTLIKLTLAGDGDCFAVLMDRHLAAVRSVSARWCLMHPTWMTSFKKSH
jgi:hypothetical protein